jgi:hypothetical protein
MSVTLFENHIKFLTIVCNFCSSLASGKELLPIPGLRYSMHCGMWSVVGRGLTLHLRQDVGRCGVYWS